MSNSPEHIQPTDRQGADIPADWEQAASFLEALALHEKVDCVLRGESLALRRSLASMSPSRQQELQALRPKLVAFLRAERDFDESHIPCPPDTTGFPLSFGQRQMLRTMQVDGRQENFHVSNVMRVEGRIDLDRLCRSVEAAVSHHHVLKTRFVSDAAVKDGFTQHVDRCREVACRQSDWRHLTPGEKDSRLQELIFRNRHSPFNLAQGPLYRIEAAWISENECYLLMTFHHLVLDDVSMTRLHREIAARYGHEQNPSQAATGADDYARFVGWESRWIGSPAGIRQTAYWEQRLRSLPPVLELPTDRPRTAKVDSACASIMGTIDESTASDLKALARRQRTSIFPVLMSAFGVLSWRLSLRRRLPIATLVANRQHEAFEDSVGLFFNTLVFVLDIEPQAAFTELVAQVSADVLSGIQRGGVPFLHLVERLAGPREPTYAPLAQVLFSYVNTPLGELQADGLSLRKGGGELDVGSAYDMRVTAYELAGEIKLAMQYRTSLIDEATARSWLAVYKHLLASIARSPQSAVRDLGLVRTATADGAQPSELDYLVLDEWHKPLPDGLVGRLHRVEHPNPGAEAPPGAIDWKGGLWLWDTGLLARRRPSGDLEMYSEPDYLIAVSGEPLDKAGMVDALMSFPGVVDAAVTLHTPTDLIGHLVLPPLEQIDAARLRQHLASRLPPQAVPVRFRRVPRIPLRVGGVINVPTLMEIGTDICPASDGQPLSAAGEAILKVWAETLRLPAVRADDNFFAVGGNSFTGALVVANVNRMFGCHATLRHLFEARTVAGFAAAIDELIATGKKSSADL